MLTGNALIRGGRSECGVGIPPLMAFGMHYSMAGTESLTEFHPLSEHTAEFFTHE
jgi:hypothetical protein